MQHVLLTVVTFPSVFTWTEKINNQIIKKDYLINNGQEVFITLILQAGNLMGFCASVNPMLYAPKAKDTFYGLTEV